MCEYNFKALFYIRKEFIDETIHAVTFYFSYFHFAFISFFAFCFISSYILPYILFLHLLAFHFFISHCLLSFSKTSLYIQNNTSLSTMFLIFHFSFCFFLLFCKIRRKKSSVFFFQKTEDCDLGNLISHFHICFLHSISLKLRQRSGSSAFW